MEMYVGIMYSSILFYYQHWMEAGGKLRATGRAPPLSTAYKTGWVPDEICVAW